MSDHLPAPWTSRPCEHCGEDHPPAEDCLPRTGPSVFNPPEGDLIAALSEVFGQPEELLPGILIFSRGPK